MQIHLPNTAFLGNIDPFLKKFDPTNEMELKITANQKWISIHPLAICMVAALGLKADTVHCEELKAKSKHYLQRMGLFKLLGLSSEQQIIEHDPAGRFIPLTIIDNSEYLTKFITDMIPLLHLDPRHTEPIKYIVSELVRNVLEHARSEAIVCAQYYPKSNRISIGIVDTGTGIKKTITHSHRAETDLEAIQLALKPGITGTTRREGGTEMNVGAGLFFIKSIAKVNRDFFVIYSGKAMYKLLKGKPEAKRIRLYEDPFADRHSKDDDYPYWTGTAVGIDISLDTTEEFSTLLDHIGDVFEKSIRERKKARYRRPKFT